MCIAILIDTADSSLGRVDKASFSDQTLMEMVITGITNKEKICGDSSESQDIEAWVGVRIEDDKWIQIDWQRYCLKGSLQLGWLPTTVTHFVAYFNRLTGTVDFVSLPPAMKSLHLELNSLTGTIDLRTLPDDQEVLDVSENQLSGSVDLTRLSRNILHMYLNKNRFNGSLDLTRLPDNIEWLDFSENRFSGTVHLSHLPSCMEYLALSDNELFGDVFIVPALFYCVDVYDTKLAKRIFEVAPLDSKHVPRCWQTSLMGQFYASISVDGKIKLSKGNLSHDYCEWKGVICDAGVVRKIRYNKKTCGNFDVHSLSPTVEKIQIDRSQQKYALQTRAFPRELKTCSLSFNQLFGSVDLLTLPTNLRFIDLSENELTGSIALTSLPCNLEHLRLYSNRIVQSVVYYDHLPPEVKEIGLITNTEETNRIGNVCAVHAEMAVKNKEIFKPMPQVKVR